MGRGIVAVVLAEALDVDHYVPSLIEGVFGNRRWMSELGKRGEAVHLSSFRMAGRQPRRGETR
jgi:hypothetical protein